MSRAARSAGWGMLGHLAVPVSTGVLVLGLPFLLDPEAYGYWQLYLFYALWLGYLTFGIPDGHHLRHAGQPLGALHPGRFAGTTAHLLVVVAVTAGALAIVGVVVLDDPTRELMWVLACASTVAFVPRTLLTAALQSASRFGPFAAVVLSERGLVVGLTLVAFAAAGADPTALATADVVAKVVGLVLGIVVVRRLLARAAATNRRTTAPAGGSAWSETRADVAAGSLLVVANLAAVAVHGVLRLAVERRWGVVEFGQVSLAFSVALLLTTAAHATGWVALPRLARTPPERRADVHRLARDGARGPLAAVVLLYLPLETVMGRWLPDYGSALLFLGLLLPLVVVESRWRVASTGMIKVMGHLRTLLMLNLLALAAAGVLALVLTLVVPSLTGIVLSLLAVTVLRSAVADVWLARRLGTTWGEGLVLDLLVVAGLLVALWLGGLLGAVVGLVVVGAVTWWHRGATAELVARTRAELAA